ncbi:hypothetical protein [uncultured Draconibacterium sp.]|uniref:hypothetical protein n=1 Tax=uncultured Draconibacterium sp. TaxID=1573823 RepID=UPI003217C4A1
MNKKQINKKEMYDTVVSFLDSNSAVWSSISKVAEFKNQFSDVVIQIDEAQYAQQEAQVFLGKNKTQVKGVIAQKADILNDTIEAFALVTGNTKLERKMAATYSDLNRMRNADFIPAIKAIVTAAEANIEILSAEYGVTVEQVDGLKTDFDGFLTINGQPRIYRVASVQATKDLELLLNEANDILENKLDKVMSIFKRRDPGFFNGYQAARIIVDN